MKIALNVENIDPSSGGVEGYVYNLTNYLIRTGHEVHLITKSSFPIHGAHFHPTGHIRWSKLLDMIHFCLSSRKILRKDYYDIIHGFGRTIYQDIYRSGGGCHHVYYLQSLKAIPNGPMRIFRAIERRIRPRNLLTRYIEGKIYGRGKNTRIIAVSKWVRSQIMERYAIPLEDIRVIYNGVDLNRFHPRHKKGEGLALRKRLGLDGTTVFMFVSNNFRLKGLQYLIPAIYHLKNLKPKTPFSLLVIGKDRPDPFIKLARGIGVGERLIFAGGIREKMECWYGASDCLVHPTLFDPFSNVCLEALASGLPVITSKYNGAMEIMNHGEEGFVLSDPSSKEEIAIRMEAFLERDFLHQASRKARNLAEAYSIERNAMEVIDLYRDVISHKVKEAK